MSITPRRGEERDGPLVGLRSLFATVAIVQLTRQFTGYV